MSTATDELTPIRAAAATLGVTPRVLEWCARNGLLTMHKRVGDRQNLVDMDEARRAVATRRPPGRPRAERRESLPTRSEGES